MALYVYKNQMNFILSTLPCVEDILTFHLCPPNSRKIKQKIGKNTDDK